MWHCEYQDVVSFSENVCHSQRKCFCSCRPHVQLKVHDWKGRFYRARAEILPSTSLLQDWKPFDLSRNRHQTTSDPDLSSEHPILWRFADELNCACRCFDHAASSARHTQGGAHTLRIRAVRGVGATQLMVL